jgi:hypothetical protein
MEKGSIFFQKPQENTIAFPLRKVLDLLFGDPLQISLITFLQVALKAICPKKMHPFIGPAGAAKINDPTVFRL